ARGGPRAEPRSEAAPARARDGARGRAPTAAPEARPRPGPSRFDRRGPARPPPGPHLRHRRMPRTPGTARRRVSRQSRSRRIEQVALAPVERDAHAVARSAVGEPTNPRDHAMPTGLEVPLRVLAK